jgi:DNA-binding SARP family transcriptional activator
LEFRILGPLYADAGHGAAVIAQPLLQSAMAVLLLRANRTCSRSFLIDALWGSEPPRSPEAALRVCMSRLRHALGDCAIRLVTAGPPGGRAPLHRQQRGYLIQVRPGELDVDEFTDLAAQGQAELDMGNAATASAAFVQALALWGDPPLPDLPVTPVLASAVARLTNQRQAIADALVDARLALGEHDQLLSQLRAAVIADPGRERACEQLMRACHALGLRKEALEVYQLARKAALEQQGTEPGAVLSVLHRRILAEETTTDVPLRRPSRAAALTPRLPGSQTPAPPADFTGRTSEIVDIVRRLNGPGVPIVVVTGGPGMGKTVTACAAAGKLADRYADGQLYIELGGLEQQRDPQDALGNALQTMGVPARELPIAGPPRAALYRSIIAGKRVLVVIDDALSAAQARPLIPGTAGAGVLVTSRNRLGALESACVFEMQDLSVSNSITLLDQVVGDGRVSAEPIAARTVATLCAGMPLAVRLAGVVLAARPEVSIADFARELDSPNMIDLLAAEDLAVRDSIERSHRFLSDASQSALSRMVVALPDDLAGNELDRASDGDNTVLAELRRLGLVRSGSDSVRGASIHPLVRAYVRQNMKPGNLPPAPDSESA